MTPEQIANSIDETPEMGSQLKTITLTLTLDELEDLAIVIEKSYLQGTNVDKQISRALYQN